MEIRKAQVVILWSAAPQGQQAAQGPDSASPGTTPSKKVLLLHLNPDRGAYWQPVTGKIDEGETFAEGALREAEEESGLRFERHPQYLGLEHRFQGKWGPAVERAFFLPIFGGSEPPTPSLDGKEHDAYEWLDPAEAADRVKWPHNRAAIERAASGPSPLFLSRRGAFYQDGEEITHERTRELLHRSLVPLQEGTGSGWVVRVGKEELDVVLEDTARFVLSYDRASGTLKLSDGSSEVLRPESLRVRPENGLVCRLANGWEAAFTSPAYYEIAKDITESVAGEYVLHFLGSNHRLAVAGEGKGEDR